MRVISQGVYVGIFMCLQAPIEGARLRCYQGHRRDLAAEISHLFAVRTRDRSCPLGRLAVRRPLEHVHIQHPYLSQRPDDVGLCLAKAQCMQ
jgi:hypothetical protein